MSLIKITNDMFNIANRIKQVDPYYFVVYDTVKKTYQLHHSKQRFSSYCLTLGPKLNVGAVYKAQQTTQRNFEKIIKQLEQENDYKQQQQTKSLMGEAQCKLASYINYINYSSKTIDFDKLD